MTVNKWQTLLSHPIRPTFSVLSVYLNVDQTSEINLNRGFETRFNELMSSLKKGVGDSSELERLRSAEHHLRDFLKVYEVHGRALTLFFDETDGFFWHEEYDLPLRDLARWEREFCLRPLAAVTDDFERYGVVLADRANVRFFSVVMGEIEELSPAHFDPSKVRHIKTVGTDHWGSSGQVQSKADEQVRKNLRQMVRGLNAVVDSKQINRLILAGTPELTSALRNLLPKALALRVIGTIDLNGEARQKEVLEATMGINQKYERETEEQLVNEMTTAAAKNQRAVVGLGHTLKKVNEARIWQLIYSDDFHASGFQCSKCAGLFSIERENCFYCSAPIVAVNDVVERSVECALRHGAKIEIVRGEAAASLDSVGGIGAFLKARTKSVEA